MNSSSWWFVDANSVRLIRCLYWSNANKFTRRNKRETLLPIEFPKEDNDDDERDCCRCKDPESPKLGYFGCRSRGIIFIDQPSLKSRSLQAIFYPVLLPTKRRIVWNTKYIPLSYLVISKQERKKRKTFTVTTWLAIYKIIRRWLLSMMRPNCHD